MPVDTGDFDKFVLKVASGLSEPVVAKIVTNNPKVESYWPTLEGGSGKGEKPWPEPKNKTRFGQGGRIFSRQAPKGFIRPNARAIFNYLKEAYTNLILRTKRPPERKELVDATNQSGEQALRLLRASIPVDTGTAQASLELERAK